MRPARSIWAVRPGSSPLFATSTGSAPWSCMRIRAPRSRRGPTGWSLPRSRLMWCGTCTNKGKRFCGRPTAISAPMKSQTDADVLLWHGACVVHEEFKALELELLKKEHPRAKVLVHPESPAEVIRLAD